MASRSYRESENIDIVAMTPRNKYKRIMRLFVGISLVHEYVEEHFVPEFLSFEATKRDKENNKTGMIIVAREE